jgi:purine-cytosine permease-like protein
MPERMPHRDDLTLATVSLLLGLAGAGAFAVYRAVSLSNEDVAGRLAEFGSNLLWPGVLILAAVAVVVFGGWKANLD